ncbi:hypothetical protein E2542_SST17166 [Spatholobus suberectus]|nr:hypothetical protein E2542_SST17166 [Spatholobus suberectus]
MAQIQGLRSPKAVVLCNRNGAEGPVEGVADGIVLGVVRVSGEVSELRVPEYVASREDLQGAHIDRAALRERRRVRTRGEATPP